MARIRTIKPQFWDDLKIGRLSRDARLLYIGLWNFADDLGVVIADPVWLKSKIFPYDKIQLQQFEGWLKMLEETGFISLLSVKSERFYYLPTFSRHQVINRPNLEDVNVRKELLDSALNEITERSVNDHGTITERSVNDHGTITERSVTIKGEDKEYITTSTSTDVEDTGVYVRDNIISYPVEDYNAGAREETDSPESDLPKRKSRKTLRKDDAGIEEARILTWRDDFEIYKNELRKAYKTLLQDDAWISTQQRFNPNLNIALSLEKACVNFWATEAGWQHKRKQRTKTIDWRQTLTNSINSPQNKVYNDNGISKKTANNGVSEDFKRGVLETLLSGGNTE